MTLRLLTEHHLEFLSLKGGCTGLSEYTLVEKPHCWKSHVLAHILFQDIFRGYCLEDIIYLCLGLDSNCWLFAGVVRFGKHC